MRVRARGSPRLPRGWKGGEGRRAHGTCAACRCGSAPRLAPLQSCPEGGRGRSAHTGPRAARWGRGAAGDREANSGPSSRASAGRPLEAPGAPAPPPGRPSGGSYVTGRWCSLVSSKRLYPGLKEMSPPGVPGRGPHVQLQNPCAPTEPVRPRNQLKESRPSDCIRVTVEYLFTSYSTF
ncbi:collagen alpha-1(I) chain-like isoform X3 [Felis catus]|uniref:collagen alpha-1(I) chain-like isoform X3 n=1 Tax=Felis catus TaxID=9685 RepID=UPI001D19AEFB|nr:collagen alpha-1(I) chain-like isoform X3 [Felis catus]